MPWTNVYAGVPQKSILGPLLNPQDGCVKIGSYQLSWGQFFLQFSGDNNYHEGHVTKKLATCDSGEYLPASDCLCGFAQKSWPITQWI